MMALQPFRGEYKIALLDFSVDQISIKTHLILLSSNNSQVILASHEDRYEAQHQAVDVITTLIEYDENWIADQTDLITALKSIWNTDLYKVNKVDIIVINSAKLKSNFVQIF